MRLIGTKDKQISDLEDKIATLEATLNNSQTESTEREEEVSHLKLELEQKEKQISSLEKTLADNRAFPQELEETTLLEGDRKHKKMRDLEKKCYALEATFSKRLTQIDKQVKLMKGPHEMQNMLETDHKKYQIAQIDKEMAMIKAVNDAPGKRLEGSQQQISSLEKILADKRAVLTTARTKSPKRTHSNPVGGTSRWKSQHYPVVQSVIDDSHTTENNENLGKDETDFSKSQGCSDDTGTKVSRAFKEYRIDNDSVGKGFNLAFTCDGTDMRIELRINKDSDGIICHYEFKNGEIIPSYGGKPEKTIGFTKGTQYKLNLCNHMRVLSLFQINSEERNECVKKFDQYDFQQIRLLCIYKSDACSVSILDHLGLIEYS